MMKAVFFDRDGTLNADEEGYINDPCNFHLLQSASEVLKYLKLLDYKIFIITNQSGIGRGVISPEAYRKVNNKFLALVDGYNIIDDILYCPHVPDQKCGCRKPKTMLMEIVKEQYKINFSASYFIGDKATDIICGNKLGLKTVLVVNPAAKKMKKTNDPDAEPVLIVESVQDLMTIISN
jgi:D-glycero-D-manno-heptose 1,7-bisphosphate phosphatase